MNEDIYYIVTEGGAPATEEPPGKAERPPSSANGTTSPKRARRWSP